MNSMDTAWDAELTSFFHQLSTVQEQTLGVLMRKRDLLAKADTAGLAALAGDEEQILRGLQQCLERREELLDRARQEALPSDSIRSLAKALPSQCQRPLCEQLRQAAHRARLLQHHCLVNWVLVHKALLHLSQLLEIIATGGRLQPTYQREGRSAASGALIDRAA